MLYNNYTMSSNYNTHLFIFVSTLRKELAEGRIDQKQFNFLLGLFFQKEINKLVNSEIQEYFSAPEEEKNKMTFLSYKRNRKFTHSHA